MFKLILAIVSASFFLTPYCFPKEPQNLELLKEKLIKYHDSGEYEKDQTKVIDKAMIYLKSRLATESKKPTHKKMAIVLDIDETSLSGYNEMLQSDFCWNPKHITLNENATTHPVIKPTLGLYQFAKINKVAVFFITGRREQKKDQTIKNLSDMGYKNWDGLFLRPENDSQKSMVPYKTSARKEIERKGYDIVLNIGDQESDLMGKHADKTFKLPNPYYLTP